MNHVYSETLWWLPKSFFLFYQVTGRNTRFNYLRYGFKYDSWNGEYKVLRTELDESKKPLLKIWWVLRPETDPKNPFLLKSPMQ